MKIRQRRFGLNQAEHKKKLNIAFLIKAGLAVAAVIIAVCLINYAVEVSNVKSSYLTGKESIVIGVRTDVAPFGITDENGEISGFDCDVTTEIIRSVFGESVQIEFRELWSENAGADLKYGNIDIAVGYIVPGTDKTNGFVTTSPYYSEPVVAVTDGMTYVESGSDLEGMNIGILNTMINTSTMTDYLDDNHITTGEILRYYDYDTAVNDLKTRIIDAFVLPKSLAEHYFGEDYNISGGLFNVGYSLMLPTGQTGICDAFSSEINRMKDNGKIDELIVKWGLDN